MIPKTNEEYVWVTYGCIRLICSFPFLSSSWDFLVETLVDKNQKTLKNLKEEIVRNDEILNIVYEMGEEERTIEILKKEYPNKIEKLNEALLKYVGENDPKILKIGFPDKWEFLTKTLANPYDYFNGMDDYQKHFDNLKLEYSFSKLKIDYPDDEKIERTKEIIKKFNIKNGEELTQLYLKSYILLLACDFENFIKVSVNEFGINPLF